MSGSNRLGSETSPYLLQHAGNPVDWYPWGPEALQRAKAEGCPILLSIGYSACHWCHVMERESFENEEIAALMNEGFVNVKVDREERPDLDDIYMAATMALSGHGGWPMTVFLTPDLQPFFAGTYFPPESRFGRPGFRDVLAHLSEMWASKRDNLVEQAKEVTAALAKEAKGGVARNIGQAEISRAVTQLEREFDERHGGFGGAPKFPPTPALRLLLRVHERTGDERALEMVTSTLTGMARGGICDHVGGGFARYSTDERWLVPHFEKMLYDNAQLARVYTEAYLHTGNAEFRAVAIDVLDYVLRDMTSTEGGFYSSTDADSEGVEGKFFVWTPSEVQKAFSDGGESPSAAEAFCTVFDITEAGNWEGNSIPNLPRPLADVASELGWGESSLTEAITGWRELMRKARAERVAPGLDDKVLTSWNALMLGAFAYGYRAFGDERYLEAAKRAADFIDDVHTDNSEATPRLLRTSRGGTAHLQAYLEDYAFLTEALIELYEASGDTRFLQRAGTLVERIVSDFADPDSGGFFSVGDDHEELIVRRMEGNDGAIPNANAVAALSLFRLGAYLDRPELVDAGTRAVQAHGKTITRASRAFATSLIALDWQLGPQLEIVVVGEPDDSAREAMLREVNDAFLPRALLITRNPGTDSDLDRLLPLAAGKTEGPATYLCRERVCAAPLKDPLEVRAALGAEGAERESERGTTLGSALPGRASAEGTARGLRRHKVGDNGTRAFGPTGLTTSILGFGGYRVHEDAPDHREALEAAFRAGVNLIDTSTNYTGGASERLIGEVLQQLTQEGTVARDEVIVVTKVGYVQGENLELARDREANDNPFPEMVKVDDDVWHCIHPDFVADQLARSRTRLQLETLDCVLLHNPEYFFDATDDEGLEELRDTFYARVRKAFEYLEGECAAGRLGWYGVSSNTVGGEPEHRKTTSVGRFVACAEAAAKGKPHHFAVLQLPMNLLEVGPASVPNTGEDGSVTALQAAQAAGLAVLVNRPLNAMQDGRLVRLADFAQEGDEQGPTLGDALQAVRGLESQLQDSLNVELRTNVGTIRTGAFFRWADELAPLQIEITGLPQWEQIRAFGIESRLRQTLGLLDRGLRGSHAALWRDTRRDYLTALAGLLDALERHARARSRLRSQQIGGTVTRAFPEVEGPLTQGALRILASVEGVSTVLVGMRRKTYVDDAMMVTDRPKVQNAAQRLIELAAELGE